MIDEYFDQHVRLCRDCVEVLALAPFITSDQLPPFVGGESPRVLLLGQDPTIDSEKPLETVLGMRSRSRPLFGYIAGSILYPLDIPIDEVATTNLIKCASRQKPRVIERTQGIPYIEMCARNCFWHLEEEIRLMQPRLLISFGQPVLRTLCTLVGKEPVWMRDVFAEPMSLTIAEVEMSWLACVHISSRSEAHYAEQWDKLRDLAPAMARLLQRTEMK